MDRNFELHTARQILRRMMPDDARGILELNADPMVRLYTFDDPFASLEAARAFLEDDQHVYDREGFARFAAIHASTGAFLGWCGLRRQSGGEVDLGYRYKREMWGHGYATEAALASLRFGFDLAKLNRIIARAHVNNTASIRIMQKIGMRCEANDTFATRPAVRYAIHAREPHSVSTVS
jgi:RimJ/RimL family protein N-acetyltransferase